MTILLKLSNELKFSKELLRFLFDNRSHFFDCRSLVGKNLLFLEFYVNLDEILLKFFTRILQRFYNALQSRAFVLPVLIFAKFAFTEFVFAKLIFLAFVFLEPS